MEISLRFYFGFVSGGIIVRHLPARVAFVVCASFFSMQPSEICRVATLLAAAAFLDRRGQRIRDVSTLFGLGALLVPVFGLIMMQPDFSSVVVTFPAILVLLYCTGVNVFYLGLIGLFAGVAGFFTIAWTYIYLHPDLQEYWLVHDFTNWLTTVGIWQGFPYW